MNDLPIISFSVDCNGNTLLPGAIGVLADSFAVIVPGAEWSIVGSPLGGDGSADLGGIVGLMSPIVWSVGDPLQGFAVKLIPGGVYPNPNAFGLRIVAPDLVTPLAGAAFVCGARLFRYGPTS